MDLLDIVGRDPVPGPWVEGDNIPWNEPGFSRRMLAEHLSQDHDLASRRVGRIDEQVAWVHRELLGGKPGRVLDLCCGPGLYTSRLAERGHDCVGIDFSPAAIAHARDHAPRSARCAYRHEDVRTADFGQGFDLVMLIYGQFNVFRPTEARDLLAKAHRALVPGGVLLLEPTRRETLQAVGGNWHAAQRGLFSETPYLCLEESHWDDATQTKTTRFYVIDAATGQVARYALTDQAYSAGQLRQILESCGFVNVQVLPAMGEPANGENEVLFAVVAKKAAEDDSQSPSP